MFYDASFRFPQNLLIGNVFSLGNYHQCLAINQPEGIRGKYCLIQTHSLQIPILAGGNVTWAEVENVWSEENLRAYKAMPGLALNDEDISRTSVFDIINGVPSLTLAICIPRSCKVADVLEALDSNYNVQFNYTEQFCRLPGDKLHSGADITALDNMFLASTKPDELRSCFSVYGNTDRLLTLTSKPGALDCLDGIRALSILWVITGHSFLAHLNTYLSNYFDLLELARGPAGVAQLCILRRLHAGGGRSAAGAQQVQARAQPPPQHCHGGLACRAAGSAGQAYVAGVARGGASNSARQASQERARRSRRVSVPATAPASGPPLGRRGRLAHAVQAGRALPESCRRRPAAAAAGRRCLGVPLGRFQCERQLHRLFWSTNLRAFYILAANLSVDSFFALSGLLLVYTAANKMKPMQLIKNLHLFYLHRLLRMFPLLAAAVLLQASVFHQVSDGVRWNRVAWETQKCRDHWWSALLHIQNLVNPRAMCVAHSWYLSVDVQLHILSPLLLFWVLGSRRSAWAGLAAAILGSLTFVTVYSFLMNFNGDQLDDRYSVYFYRNTLARSPVFIIGMLCGYMLHVTRNKKIVMPWWLVCFGHTLAIVLLGYCMYHEHPEWSQLAINLNIALVRPAWAVSLCWLIVACVNGYAGPINWFLSINLWKFVARISYAMYIFHLPMQFIMVGANIMPIYFKFETVFINLASDVAYAVIVAVVMCVLVDAPFSTLIRRLMAVIVPAHPKKPA
ncbi:uncharacterized protein LOC134669803 [Cydia fagiglandana]|uniref:uncharacterized protein LOC134669803 n=1 Tax=Cydia fagiglandana TaxID=1458189 RepID=UPI002FEE477A